MNSRVLIADHTISLGDPTVLAIQAMGLEVPGICHHAGPVLDAARRWTADVALVARDLPGDGLVAARELADADIPVVLRCDDLDDDDLVTALRAGVRGMLPTDLDLRALVMSLVGVLEGELAVPRVTTPRILEAFRRRRDALNRAAPGTSLTDREWDVLERLARGESTAAIATELGVAAVTVRTHVAAIRRKLGVGTREEAETALREQGG